MARIKEKKQAKTEPKKHESQEQSDRRIRVVSRFDQMLQARRPFERRIRRSLLLYSGQSLDKGMPDKVRYVSPFAFIFVEAKTAEEVRAMSEFDIRPVEDAHDAWKIPFLKDSVEFAFSKTHWRSKRIQMLRMKNISGVSIVRIGHRRIEGKRKIGREYDEAGRMRGWKEKVVPVYDDLFMDLVPPLDFVIDPNAVTLNEAMDCGHFHAEHVDNFREIYGNDPRFYDIESIEKGDEGMIGIAEYFNKTLDEWILYAFPHSKTSQYNLSQEIGNWTEIGALPLTDDHKELPFAEYQDNSSFAELQIEQGISRTESGEATSQPLVVRDSEVFWKQGVPSVIEDLIDLRTDFGRSAYRALDLAGQPIIATAGNYSLDEAVPWKSGMQAIGGMNKMQSFNLAAGININSYDYAFSDLFEQMVMATGVDPRNLTDIGKVQTATQSMIQNETAAKRLNLGIVFNEENGETRIGQLVVGNIQQYYSIPEIVRFSGKETKEELENFDEVEEEEENGKKIPVKGKRYRTIPSDRKLVEDGKKNLLEVKAFGKNSFLARPETIRTSEISIRVIPKRRAGQTDAIRLEKLDNFLQRLAQFVPFATPNAATGQSLLSMEELIFYLKNALEEYAKLLGAEGASKMREEKELKEESVLRIRDRYEAQRIPFNQ